MSRYTLLFVLVVLFFSSVVSGVCQSLPGCYPRAFPAIAPCKPSGPAPISRTVKVDVPVPCRPIGCRPPMPCPPHPCVPRFCAPPPPTRPVRVRVDVVVRSERPKSCGSQRFCCENPPIFEPFFCSAAGMIRSLILSPLGLGENLMGHPVGPACCQRPPCPPPIPICGPRCPPSIACVSKCAPRVLHGAGPRPTAERFALPRPGVGALPCLRPIQARTFPPTGPVSR